MEAMQPRGVNGSDDLGSVDLCDLSADGTHLMQMIVTQIARLVFGLPDEAVAHDKTQLYEKVHRVVERSPRYGEALTGQHLGKLFQRKVAVHAIHSVQDGISLGRLAQSALRKVGRENFPHLGFNGFCCHFYFFS